MIGQGKQSFGRAGLGGQSEFERQTGGSDHETVVGVVASKAVRAGLSRRGYWSSNSKTLELPVKSATAAGKVGRLHNASDRFECPAHVAVPHRIDGQIVVSARDLALSQ